MCKFLCNCINLIKCRPQMQVIFNHTFSFSCSANTVLGDKGHCKELFSTGICENIYISGILNEIVVKGPFDDNDRSDVVPDYTYRFRWENKGMSIDKRDDPSLITVTTLKAASSKIGMFTWIIERNVAKFARKGA
jgi:hypothetical protein